MTLSCTYARKIIKLINQASMYPRMYVQTIGGGADDMFRFERATETNEKKKTNENESVYEA